jgi:hypothetical protein
MSKDTLDKAISQIDNQTIFDSLIAGVKPDGKSLDAALALETGDSNYDKVAICSFLLMHGAKASEDHKEDKLLSVVDKSLKCIQILLKTKRYEQIKLYKDAISHNNGEITKSAPLADIVYKRIYEDEVSLYVSSGMLDDVNLPNAVFSFCCSQELKDRSNAKNINVVKERALPSSKPERIYLKVKKSPRPLGLPYISDRDK